MIQKSAVIVLPAFVFAAVLTAGLLDRAVRAQETGKTVADGVYSEAQATRGAASYDTSCAVAIVRTSAAPMDRRFAASASREFSPARI